MPTLAQSILARIALLTYMKDPSWQVREVQEAIREADEGDFASDDQVNAVFAKYGVPVRDSDEDKLDQVLFDLNSDQFQQFTQSLDTPDAVNQGFARLMTTHAPWAVAASQAAATQASHGFPPSRE